MPKNYIHSQTHISINSIENVLTLFEQGCTIPFIARYRKEKTKGLNEVELAKIQEAHEDYLTLTKRKESILDAIQKLGKLTPELKKKINSCFDKVTLEDLYLPYKRKVKTKATLAKEAGLTPLAKWIISNQNDDASNQINQYKTKDYSTKEKVIQGVIDIIAEWTSEYNWLRSSLRNSYENFGVITSKKKKTEHRDQDKFSDFFDYSAKISRCSSHRLLALLRGEKENILQVKVKPDEDKTLEYINRKLISGKGQNAAWVKAAITQSYKKVLHPSLENQVKNHYKEIADITAIEIFTKNLRHLLLAAPLGAKRTMGIDPGFRSGCKIVCLDEHGTLLSHTAIYPHPPQKQQNKAAEDIRKLVNTHQIQAIALGDGTASRETLQFLEEIKWDNTPEIFLINENGASIYSASELARLEFPNLDLTVRGAISIARRLVDPLAELVKIDAKSIGVGQYQHDVNQKKLKHSLDTTVISCVNHVGINLNTASEHILTYISGIGPKVASNIITYRNENGPFKKRSDLKKVAGLGPKAYEQAAGFLRIRDADNILDNTGVHPERYKLVKKMVSDQKTTLLSFINDKSIQEKVDKRKYISEDVGLPTIDDIMHELQKPGIDPRGQAKNVSFSKNITKIDDLLVGQILNGVVTNVTDFGAFINIGIKQNGLIHKSKMSKNHVVHPMDILTVSQEVTVKVIDVDIPRNRIQLSLEETI